MAEFTLRRVLLVERTSNDSAEVTWKFPSGSADEELLLRRIDFLWRECAANKCKTLCFDGIWQSLEFGTGFALILETEFVPNPDVQSICRRLALSYEQRRDVRLVAREFLQTRASFVYRSPESTYTSTQLLSLLGCFEPVDSALLWRMCLQGRVRLCGGTSGELYEVGHVLASHSGAQFIPLIVGPTRAESRELQRLGTYICSSPTDDVTEGDPADDAVFWDVSINWANRTVKKRSLLQLCAEELALKSLISVAQTDREFIAASRGVFRLAERREEDDELL